MTIDPLARMSAPDWLSTSRALVSRLGPKLWGGGMRVYGDGYATQSERLHNGYHPTLTNPYPDLDDLGTTGVLLGKLPNDVPITITCGRQHSESPPLWQVIHDGIPTPMCSSLGVAAARALLNLPKTTVEQQQDAEYTSWRGTGDRPDGWRYGPGTSYNCEPYTLAWTKHGRHWTLYTAYPSGLCTSFDFFADLNPSQPPWRQVWERTKP